MQERHPRRKATNTRTTHERITVKDKIIGNVLWCVRMMRVYQHAELTMDTVYAYQRDLFHYSSEQVKMALGTVKRRGFQWDVYLSGIPDACIVIRKKGKE